MYRIVILLLLLCGPVSAHQFTPVYPKLEPSYVQKIWKADMELLNMRQDIEYFEFSVFDEEWGSIPFALSGDRIVRIKYLDRKDIRVFIRQQDADRVTYICSKSKILAGQTQQITSVSSRICSKVQ